MKIFFSKNKIVNCECPVLVLPIYEEEKFADQTLEVDKKLGGFVADIISEGYFKPEFGTVHVVYTHEKLKSKKIVLCGMGKRNELNAERIYRAISGAVAYAGKTNASKCSVFLDSFNKEWLQNIAETSALALYKFEKHKTKNKPVRLSQILFYISTDIKESELETISQNAMINIEAIKYTRDLVNEPGNVMTPKRFGQIAKDGSKDGSVEVKVYREKKIEELGMGLVMAVSSGSREEAQLITYDYKPNKYNKTIALVGKGITFDTGGVSLKPSEAMLGMHMDMAGAATVAGVFEAIKKIKPKNIRIIGVVATAENALGHKAQRPGDIWKSYSGKTVEVLNTDAEGRLVLADLISYTQDIYKPDILIDVATLTGACVIALGTNYSGVFGNDKKIIESIVKISQDNYEKSWPLPIDEHFHSEMKGEMADLKNVGSCKDGSASTAAAFLEEFVNKNTKWAHLDIAGPAIVTKQTMPYIQKGGSGAGVKTLIEFLKNI